MGVIMASIEELWVVIVVVIKAAIVAMAIEAAIVVMTIEAAITAMD